MERIFGTNAEKLRELYQAIKVTFVDRGLDDRHYQEWVEACECFHASFDQLAFPGGLEREFDLLKHSDAQAVEMAVQYLEADPWYFRSGYIKEQLIQALRKVSLTDAQRERLREVVIERIKKGSGREFRRYCRLARDLRSAEFVAKIRQAMLSEDANISRRAGWVMSSLES